MASASRMPLQLLGSMGEDENATKACCGRLDTGVERTLWTRIWQGIAIASVVINISAMAITGGGAAIVAGIIALLVAPVVFMRQFTLQNTETLRQVQNQLRQDVNVLQVENNKLTVSNTALETQVGRLKEQEAKLDAIAKEQGTNVDSFVKLVKENRETLNSFKSSIKADTVNDLVQSLMESDFDGSSKFDDSEIDNLEIFMLTVPGVEINHELLKQRIRETDRDLSSVLSLLQELENADLLPEERIFTLDQGVREQQSIRKLQ